MMLAASLALPGFWTLVVIGGLGLVALWVRDWRAERAHEARCEAICSRGVETPTAELTILPRSAMVRGHRRTAAAWRHDGVRRWMS